MFRIKHLYRIKTCIGSKTCIESKICTGSETFFPIRVRFRFEDLYIIKDFQRTLSCRIKDLHRINDFQRVMTYIGLKTLFKREGTDRSYTFTRIHNTANSVTDVHLGLGQL